MASYTNTRAGNWSATATWGGSGPPGSGDKATISASVSQTVTGAADNGSHAIRLTMAATTVWSTGQIAYVAGVLGTTEANGRWVVTVVDSTHLDLQSSAFVNTWSSGGTQKCNPCVSVDGTPSIVGSNSSNIGIGVTISGTNASTFGALEVASGATLQLQGHSTTTNTMMQINQYGWFAPQPGSTINGACTSNYQATIINNGILSAIGTSGSHITFTATVPSWATQVTNESYSLAGADNYVYVPSDNIAIFALTHDWIANSGGTAGGSSGSTSLSFSTQSPAGILATEVSALSSVTATGDYFVDYDRGLVYFYQTYAGTTVTFKATYKYLVDSTAWRGWGIQSAANAASNSLVLTYCDFSYMGGEASSNTTVAIYAAGHKSAGANSGGTDRLLKITNCTATNCYRFLALDNITGTSGDPVLIQNNTFNNCRGDGTTLYQISLYNTASSYISISNNTTTCRQVFINWDTFGTVLTYTGLTINGNTANVGYFFRAAFPLSSLYPNSTISNNTIVGSCGAITNQVLVGGFCGTSGNAALIQNNVISNPGLFSIADSHYCTVDTNIFRHTYYGPITCQQSAGYIVSTRITNNLFYGLPGSAVDVYLAGTRCIELGTNLPVWVDGFQIINNTFLDNPLGAFAITGSFDSGTVCVLTGGEFKNNIIANTSNTWAGNGIVRYPESSTNRGPAAILDLDYNAFYQAGGTYTGCNRGGTFMMSGTRYNFNNSRNITGVTLSQPGYSTAQSSGQSLVYTYTSATNITLAWGGGTAVQIVFGHGTSSGSNSNNTTNGIVGLYSGVLNDTTQTWSTTLNNASCPSGMWIKITGGTGSGQVGMITANTSTQLTVVPAWTVVPDATSTYTIYQPEVTLTDSSGTVQGITILASGSGNTTCTFAFSGGGGSSAAATAVLGGLSAGQIVGATITNNGSGYTSIPTVTPTSDGGPPTVVATLGSVQAGIDIRTLPTSTQTDSGITLVFNDVNSNPNFSAIGSLPQHPWVLPTSTDAADAKVSGGSPVIDAGVSNNAPSLDYFGTSRPQGTAYDIGFYEALAAAAAGFPFGPFPGLPPAYYAF
jgi:hypothetical protein